MTVSDPLVAAAAGGDLEAFDELVRLTYQPTLTLALSLTRDPADAQDVVQEAYIRAYRGLRRFRGDSSFATWLYRITANCASSLMSRKACNEVVDLAERDFDPEAPPGSDPAERVETVFLRERLGEAITALPDKLRSVVILRDVYGMRHKAIADELGISETAAKLRLHRARKILRDRLFVEVSSPVTGRDRRAG